LPLPFSGDAVHGRLSFAQESTVFRLYQPDTHGRYQIEFFPFGRKKSPFSQNDFFSDLPPAATNARRNLLSNHETDHQQQEPKNV